MATSKVTCLCGKEVVVVHKEKIKLLEDRLYRINSYISGRWITRISKPSQKDLEVLNKELGEIIKQVRELGEHI